MERETGDLIYIYIYIYIYTHIFCREEIQRISWATFTRLHTGQSEVPILAGERYFSLLQNVQSFLRSTQPPVQGYRSTFLGLKRPEPEVYHSSLSSVEVKYEWSCTSARPICLHDVDGEQVYLVHFWLQITRKIFCHEVTHLDGRSFLIFIAYIKGKFALARLMKSTESCCNIILRMPGVESGHLLNMSQKEFCSLGPSV